MLVTDDSVSPDHAQIMLHPAQSRGCVDICLLHLNSAKRAPAMPGFRAVHWGPDTILRFLREGFAERR